MATIQTVGQTQKVIVIFTEKKENEYACSIESHWATRGPNSA